MCLESIPIRIGRMRIGKAWMPILIRTIDADPTRSGSTTLIIFTLYCTSHLHLYRFLDQRFKNFQFFWTSKSKDIKLEKEPPENQAFQNMKFFLFLLFPFPTQIIYRGVCVVTDSNFKKEMTVRKF
jgi:hypothetical protein